MTNYKGKIEKWRVGDMICDLNLWPRRETTYDESNLAHIRDLIKKGVKIDPPVVDRRTCKLSDGFHRHRGYRSIFGDEHVIDVEVVDYPNESEILFDSVRRNVRHGMRLDGKDLTSSIHRLEDLGYDPVAMSQTFGMTLNRYESFRKRIAVVVTKNDGVIIEDKVPLPWGAKELIGKTITTKQAEHIKHIGGVRSTTQAKMLIRQIKAKAYDLSDANLVAAFTELRDLLVNLLP